MDRVNPFRTIPEETGHLVGTRCLTFSHSMIEAYGELGLEFVWLDYEHMGKSPYDSEALEQFVRTAEVSDVELLVRVPRSDPSLIRKVLDTGVRNILVPRVRSPTEVRQIIEASKFTYNGEPGKRGMSSGRARKWGLSSSRAAYAKQEDQTVCVGVIVETEAAINQIEEIVSTPELGFVFVGPGDLSVQLGVLGDPDSEVVDAWETKVRDMCQQHGVPIGCTVGSPEAVKQKREEGYQIIRIGDEIRAVERFFES